LSGCNYDRTNAAYPVQLPDGVPVPLTDTDVDSYPNAEAKNLEPGRPVSL
jgi:hypothetical protein